MARSSFSTRTRTRSPRLTCRTTTTSASLDAEVERNAALADFELARSEWETAFRLVPDGALADFELARSEWETAFGLVPDGALAYLKPGDDYALGGLQVHVNWVLTHYRRVLDGIIAGGFGQLDPQDGPGDAEAAGKKARAGLDVRERATALKEMARLHAAIVAVVAQLPETDWSR